MSNTESIEKLLRIYERRLRIYEEQRATYGDLNVPAHLVIEIETVQEEIKKLKQQLPGGKRETVSEVGIEKEIYISYAWGGESEKIVERLDQAFQARGVTIIRDKRDLGYKGRIKAFMERIGRGKGVIVVVSEKYLKSENCMFELVQIAKNGRFYDRIFPIVLDDANIYKPVNRIKYIKYWEEQIQELDEAMKSVNSANLQGLRDDIDSYTEIRRTIAELTNILKDMNTLTPEMHSQADFETLFQAIEQKMAE
jgi:internalin A